MIRCRSCSLEFPEAETSIHVETKHVGPRSTFIYRICCGFCRYSVPEDKVQLMMEHCANTGHNASKVTSDWTHFIKTESDRVVRLISIGSDILAGQNGYPAKKENLQMIKKSFLQDDFEENKIVRNIPIQGVSPKARILKVPVKRSQNPRPPSRPYRNDEYSIAGSASRPVSSGTENPLCRIPSIQPSQKRAKAQTRENDVSLKPEMTSIKNERIDEVTPNKSLIELDEENKESEEPKTPQQNKNKAEESVEMNQGDESIEPVEVELEIKPQIDGFDMKPLDPENHNEDYRVVPAHFKTVSPSRKQKSTHSKDGNRQFTDNLKMSLKGHQKVKTPHRKTRESFSKPRGAGALTSLECKLCENVTSARSFSMAKDYAFMHAVSHGKFHYFRCPGCDFSTKTKATTFVHLRRKGAEGMGCIGVPIPVEPTEESIRTLASLLPQCYPDVDFRGRWYNGICWKYNEYPDPEPIQFQPPENPSKIVERKIVFPISFNPDNSIEKEEI